jgi:hypothetical protein
MCSLYLSLMDRFDVKLGKRPPVAVSTDGFIRPTMTLLAMATDVSC